MNLDVLKEQVNRIFRAFPGSFLDRPPQEIMYTIRPLPGKIPKFLVVTDYGSADAVGLYQAIVKHFEQATDKAWQNQHVECEKFLDDAFMQVYQMALDDVGEPTLLIIHDLEEQRFRILSWHPNACDEFEDTDCDFCAERAADTSSDCFVGALLDHAKAVQAYNSEFKIAHT